MSVIPGAWNPEHGGSGANAEAQHRFLALAEAFKQRGIPVRGGTVYLVVSE